MPGLDRPEGLAGKSQFAQSAAAQDVAGMRENIKNMKIA